MMSNLQSELLSGLKSVRARFYGTNSDTERMELIMAVCDIAARDCKEPIKDNLRNIVNYFHSLGALNVDDLIELLLKNQGLDIETVQREKEDGFDKRFGTITSPILTQYELPEKISMQRFQTSGRYHPSPISSVRAALETLPNHAVRYEDFTFIDIGSGMARNLLLAAEYPFREIIGIEHSPYLHELAEMNVKAYASVGRNCENIRLICADALQYRFPSGNLVLYFWHPFTNEIADRFFAGVESHLARGKNRMILVFLEAVYPIVKRLKNLK